MIFVSIGTHNQPFNRLLEEVDRLVEKDSIKKEVVMQVGYSSYVPKNTKYFKWASIDEMEKIYKKMDVLISHGGIGTIIGGFKYGKPVIVVPRLKRFGEHTNDHQLDLTRALEKEKRIIAIYDIKDLEQAIKKARKWHIKKAKTNVRIIKLIKDFLNQL